MIQFLRRLWSLVLPYKGRLILGIVCGLIGGMMNPLLMMTVKLSMEVVFPGEGDPLVSIPTATINSNRVSSGLILQANTSHLTVTNLDERITNWPGANDFGTNLLTITVGEGSNAVSSRFQLTREEPKAAESTFSGVKAFFSGYSKRFHDSLREIALSKNHLLIGLVVMSVPLAMLLRCLFSYLNTYFMMWISLRATADMRARLFDHVIHQPISFFNKVSTAELMTVVNRVPALQGIVGESLAVLIIQPVTVIGLLVLLMTRHGDLTLVSIFIFPVCVGAAAYFGKKTRQNASRGSVSVVNLNQQMHEAFTATRVVKAYNLEESVLERFKHISRQVVSNTMRLVRSQELPGPIVEFMGSVGVAFFFMYIATKAGAKPKASDFIEFVGSVFLMYAPIKSIVRLHSQIEQGRALSERIFEFIDTETTIPEPANPVPLKAGGKDIHFENINFSYGDKPVLKNINLTVKAGQLVAIVGQTGSGKTTLTNLLLRFYDPQRGVVKIGDTDIRNVNSKELRSQIAVVTQETILFNDTIRKNIELGRPGATEQELLTAAKHAHVDEFIPEKKGGYDFIVGEKGALLSGGQRQRVAIARSILRDAPILILDEATNALDTKIERDVQEALDKLMVGRTTICIAHRLTTIHHADLIVVMKEGCIAEMGTHDELIKNNGIYKMLYGLQFADREPGDKSDKESGDKNSKESAEEASKESSDKRTKESKDNNSKENADNSSRESADKNTKEPKEKGSTDSTDQGTKESGDKNSKESAD